MFTLQTCVDINLRLSGRVNEIGLVAIRLLLLGAPFVKKNEVAPVSATARVGLMVNAFA